MYRQILNSNSTAYKNFCRNLQTFDNYLVISTDTPQKTQKFYYFWLRDHCRCNECYNTNTYQRSYHVLDIPKEIKPRTFKKTNEDLLVTWEDGHYSKYPLKWLTSLEFPQRKKREHFLWNKKSASNITDNIVHKSEIENDVKVGSKKLFTALLKYGFAFVSGVNPTLEATENVITKVAPAQKTFFGEMWELTNDLYYKDTAYTNIALASHTDNTYFTEATGLLVFNLLSHSGSGGETLLVDGFNAAFNLKKKNPEAYDILRSNSIESEYIEEGVHYSYVDYVIKEHPLTNDLWQIRYNVYDRAVFNTLPIEKLLPFYDAYRAFSEEVRANDNELRLKLQPGHVLIIDNWRVMHGRSSFTGMRKIGGCYISRSDWISKARYLGLSEF